MCGVEHTVSLFFNDVSKIPIVNQMISAHKMIYNNLRSGIYHTPRPIFKPRSKEFHNIQLLFLEEMILRWMPISWGYTETCVCK